MYNQRLLLIFSLLSVMIHAIGGNTTEFLPLENWQFESYHLEYNDNWTANLIKSESSIAAYDFSSNKKYAELKCFLENGRAELSSQALKLKPFTWYAVEIQYQTISTSDSMVTLAGLYPDSSRFLMDQVILPPTSGKIITQQVLMHTGDSNHDYHFFLANTGIGESVFYNFHFSELSPCKTPSENLMIVDLLKFTPDPENLNLWKSLKKFTRVFGFGQPTYIHPLQASKTKMEEARPGIIIFTPTAVDTEDFKMGFLKKKRFDKGIGRIIEYAENNRIPVLGICAGHQSIALHYGGFLARLKDDETGQYLKEIGPTSLKILKEDPIFDNLPDKHNLKITEAHMIMVGYNFNLPENLAVSTDFGNQIFRYHHIEGTPWYTFQGHIEKDWEYASPEGSVVMNNLLSNWGLIQNRFLVQEEL